MNIVRGNLTTPSLIEAILTEIPKEQGTPPVQTNYGFDLTWEGTQFRIQVYKHPGESQQVQIFLDPAWANDEPGQKLAREFTDKLELAFFRSVNGRGANRIDIVADHIYLKFQ